MKPLIVAAVIVDDLAHPTRVLCAQRSAPVALDGKWEFPGGKVEPGELPDDALAREILEELGVTLTLGDRVGDDWPLPNGSHMRLWYAVVENGTPRPLEDHHELRWVVGHTIDELDWLDGDWAIVRYLKSTLAANW